jgi:hypothetical protein
MTASGLTYAQVNGLQAEFQANNPDAADAGKFNVTVAAATLSVTYDVVIPATSGAAAQTPYLRTNAATRAVLRVDGVFSTGTVFVAHGTIYTPAAAIDLSETAVPYTVVDRGILARHVYLGLTSAAAAPPLIGLPAVPSRLPRFLSISILAGAVEQLRIYARFSDAAGTSSGSLVRVDQWSHQR